MCLRLLAVFELESNFYRYLEFGNLAVTNQATLFDDFEPTKISESLGGALHSCLNCIIKTLGRATNYFGHFINVCHIYLLSKFLKADPQIRSGSTLIP